MSRWEYHVAVDTCAPHVRNAPQCVNAPSVSAGQVASIPRHACLSSDPDDAPRGTLRAWAHSLLAEIFPTDDADLPFERDVAILTLQLLLEQSAGKRSYFYPWLATLPRAEELNLPALWPENHLAELHGTLLLRDVLDSVDTAKAEWRHVSAAFRRTPGDEVRSDGVERLRQWLGPDFGLTLNKLNMEGWLLARCLIQSRAYRVGGRCASVVHSSLR